MLIEWGRQQNAKLAVIGQNLHALKQTLLLSLFNAEKSVGGHVKKSIALSLYTVLSISSLYICPNPFIYATKLDPVKCVLMGLIPFNKHNMQTSRTSNCA